MIPYKLIKHALLIALAFFIVIISLQSGSKAADTENSFKLDVKTDVHPIEII